MLTSSFLKGAEVGIQHVAERRVSRGVVDQDVEAAEPFLMPAKPWLICSISPKWQALNTRVSPLASGALIAISICLLIRELGFLSHHVLTYLSVMTVSRVLIFPDS
jgi:hypothetical protein